MWALAESLGILPRAYLAALTDIALLDKAEVLIRLGDPPKAQRVLDALARRAIDDPRVLGQLANLELRNGNKDVARRAQLRAAQAYLQRGMVDEAVHVLQQILAVARDCLEARLALGQIAEGRYGHEEAVAHYLEAVKVLQARQESEGVAELLDRVRQLNRVKTVLESETQMIQPQLPAGRMQALLTAGPSVVEVGPPVEEVQYPVDAEDGATQLDMRGPLARAHGRPAIAEVATDRGGPLQTLTEAETVADMPSPLYAGGARRGRDLPRNPRAPSTVIVEPDLAFPDTTDPVGAPPAPPIPSTFVRSRSLPPLHERHAAESGDESAWAAEARDAQIKQPTDIVMRDALPPELLIKVDTAVDFDPRRLKAGAAVPSVVVVPPSAVSTDATEALARVSAQPSAVRERRGQSVWDRAIVRGPREAITLNVGPEPEPLEPGTPSILRRATSGISSALDGFLSNVSGPKDGGGTKS